MRKITVVLILSLLALIAFHGNSLAQTTILHDFAGFPSDGELSIFNGLISDGSVLYGMTLEGGTSDYGIIFKINPDGSGYEVLHQFAGGPGDGNWPWGNLLLVGSMLYGMTERGGGDAYGSIFRINPDGTGFELIHSFDSSGVEGIDPRGSLVSDGVALYGATSLGEVSNAGVLFKINLDGTGFELLHVFTGGVDDGAVPYESPILVGSALYGMTAGGGDSDAGVIYKINTDGTGFELLHEFTGGVDDGGYPEGALVSDGSALYGMSEYGGPTDDGVVFRINLDGSGFTVLHGFAPGTDDVHWPDGTLILDGSTLYGMAPEGGANDLGGIFSINTDGSGYAILHEFAGPTSDGAYPNGTLLLTDSTLYGMTPGGGANDLGVIFSLAVAQPTEAQPIPTLSEWGVIILAVLLAFAAFVLIKRQALNSTRPA